MKMDLDKRLQNIHQYTKLYYCFRNIHREHDPEPPWQACGYIQYHYFLYEYLHVLKIMKTKLLTRSERLFLLFFRGDRAQKITEKM